MKNTSPILPLIAAAVVIVGLFCVSVNNERTAAVNAEWAAAAAPIFEARGIPFPKNPTPRDLQEALDINTAYGYAAAMKKSNGKSPRLETEIIIRGERTIGQLLEEKRQIDALLAKKPSF